MAHIIKSSGSSSGDPADDIRRPMAFDFPDWTRRAEEHLAAIRRQAEQIISEAHAEAEQIRLAAKQEGLAAGQQQAAAIAREVAEKQLSTLLPSLREFTQQLHAARGEWLRQWEQRLVQLAAEMAKAITGRVIEERPDITIEWIREALELVSSRGRVIVRLNPHDRAAVEPHVASLRECLHPEAELVIIDDATVEQGGAVVQTDFGEIDQQLSARVQRVFEELQA